MCAGGARKKSVVALLTAVPFGIAAAVILGNAYHSKATGERRWHVAAPLAFAACALFALAFLLKCAPQCPCIHTATLHPGLVVVHFLSAVTEHLWVHRPAGGWSRARY